jgi:hypothetical protein
MALSIAATSSGECGMKGMGFTVGLKWNRRERTRGDQSRVTRLMERSSESEAPSATRFRSIPHTRSG